ncbi:Choline-sulfatase [Maioricimonas rarisocia]|uniref:Choline-sulfatase n=1 Tax=Maioricimonas rarisocia TaxID=2528026 RepID=A0A517Z5K6_9PLAN|nr:sulfatase-like hydrolase/transferase [Maioricimonas rarisocia]QDU37731.1 Choline-sulfatase [Maioricimonas rarisocia]
MRSAVVCRPGFVLLIVIAIGIRPAWSAERRPNVLFVAIDDLNDWVGCLGGHPQAKTPNIDRLAARGMLFTNAHCSASLCNPSRASVMTGTLPSTNGVHGNQQDWRRSPYLEGHPTLPEFFRQQGYWTGACGKIFHANHGGECGALNGGHGGLRGFNHPESWTERFPSKNQQLAKLPVMTGRNFNGLETWHWDWAAIDVADDETEDGQAAAWAESMLREREDEPFFLAVGIYKPHGPWYCPPAYFEQHPLESIRLPQLNPANDLDDVPAIAKRHLGSYFGDYHSRILEQGLYESAVQAYLANVTFADAMLGRVLDALDARDDADETVIVLWSDHGWHLGEKQKWHKGTNWEEGTRVPLIVVAPGVAEPGSRCDEPVSLVDLYPTLLDLTGLPNVDGLDGESLVPQLQNPRAERERPAYTINGGRHQSVRSKRWRYVRYADGSEELYDHQSDPTEYTNLADRREYAELKQELAAWFPEEIRRVEYRSEPPLEAGFRPLFNGYDLTSWEGDPSLWRVEDGKIVGETTEGAPLPHNSFLVWRGATLRDFELRLRVRVIGEYNSGIQYRSRDLADRSDYVVGGYQCDLHPDPEKLGMLYEEKGRGIIAGREEKVLVTQDGRRFLTGSSPEDVRPVNLGEWNDVTIIARGDRLVHKVNGHVACEVFDADEERGTSSGLLAIQLHRGAPMRVEVADVRLREMAPPPEDVAGIEVPADAQERPWPRRRR